MKLPEELIKKGPEVFLKQLPEEFSKGCLWELWEKFLKKKMLRREVKIQISIQWNLILQILTPRAH